MLLVKRRDKLERLFLSGFFSLVKYLQVMPAVYPRGDNFMYHSDRLFLSGANDYTGNVNHTFSRVKILR